MLSMGQESKNLLGHSTAPVFLQVGSPGRFRVRASGVLVVPLGYLAAGPAVASLVRA